MRRAALALVLVGLVIEPCGLDGQAPANLALGKPATQSSTYGPEYPASKGVDGVRGSRGFFHTNSDPAAWWQVDLQTEHPLDRVVLLNRSDCCGDRAGRVMVLASGDGRNWETLYRHDGTAFTALQVDAKGHTARYVRVQLEGTNYLHLDEVEVYGRASQTRAQLAFDEGVAFETQGRLVEARDAYARAIQADPQSAEAWRKRGWIRERLGDRKGAVADYDKAISIDPGNAKAWNGRGVARQNAGDLAGALLDFQKAIELDPRYSSPWSNRAILKRLQKDLKGSLEDADHALSLDPTSVSALYTRGVSRRDLKDSKGALADFSQAIALDPTLARAWAARGLAKADLHDTRGAIADVDQALALEPENAVLLTNRAFVRRQVGNLDGARADYIRALALDPANAAAKRGLELMGPEAATPPLGTVLETPTWTLRPKSALDLAGLTRAHATGLAATLSAGAEAAAGANPGAMTSLAALYDFVPPQASPAAVKQAEMLQQAAILRAATSAALGGARQAWQEAVLAAQYGNEAATREALGIVRTHLDTASAAQEGLRKRAADSKAVPAVPNAAAEKAKANEAYRRLVAHIRAVLTADAAPTPGGTARGCFKLIDTHMERSEGTYDGPGVESGWSSSWVDFGTQENKTTRWRWKVPQILIPGQPARIHIEGSGTASTAGYFNLSPVGGLLAGMRVGWKHENIVDIPSDDFDLVIPADLPKAQKDYMDGRGARQIVFRRRHKDGDGIFSPQGGRFNPRVPSAVPMADYPDRLIDWFSLDRGTLVLSVEQIFANPVASYLYHYTEECAPAGKGSQGVADDAPLPALPPDKAKQVELHRANLRLISAHLAKDQAELANEKDPRRRAELEWRVLQDRSDLVAEQDLIDSIQKGVIVHTRSPFDDYAHDRFVESIRDTQKEIVDFQRERAAIPRLLALMPAEEQQAMQAFVDRQLTPELLARMDHAKLREIATALSNQVQGYWQGESARHTEQAEQYNDYLTRAERVKTIADTAVMIGSMGSASAYQAGAAYAAAAGGLTGGPVEAVNQAALYYAAPVHAAVEAMKAYPTDGLWGATKAGAVGFVMASLTQLGAPGAQAERLTATEVTKLAEFQRAKARGEALVREFEDAHKALASARTAGRPIAEVRAFERQLAERVASVQTDIHAKAFLKYKAEAPIQRVFTGEVDALHYQVENRFHQIMAEGQWNPQRLKAIRNSSSAGSVNMDFDIGLVEGPGLSFAKNGQSQSIGQWQKEAQEAWERAFREQTGQNAAHAMEEVTTSVHAEAYKDLAWIGRDPTLTSATWAKQAGDVTRYKAQEVLVSSKYEWDYYTRLMEASRGTAKDIKTKLLDRLELFKNRVPGPDGGARQQALLEKYREIQGILQDIGEGRIDPVHGDRMVRNMTGGYGITDVIDHAATLLSEFGSQAAVR